MFLGIVFNTALPFNFQIADWTIYISIYQICWPRLEGMTTFFILYSKRNLLAFIFSEYNKSGFDSLNTIFLLFFVPWAHKSIYAQKRPDESGLDCFGLATLSK